MKYVMSARVHETRLPLDHYTEYYWTGSNKAYFEYLAAKFSSTREYMATTILITDVYNSHVRHPLYVVEHKYRYINCKM